MVTTMTSSALDATSLPPPLPTRNVRPGTMVESMSPRSSTIAAPRQASVVVPGPDTTMPRMSEASASIVADGKARWLNTKGSAGVGS